MTGTFLSGCHLEAKVIIILGLFISMNRPTKEIAEKIKCSEATVSIWRRKFKAFEILKDRS